MKLYIKITSKLNDYQDRISNQFYKILSLNIIFPIVKLLSLFIILYGASVSACKIFVLDCGQGNAVVARHKKETVVFDADRMK